jgi:phosphoketolase
VNDAGEPARLDAYWRAANYLSPGLNFVYAHLNRLIRQFSFPGGIPSHVAPETPGSIQGTTTTPFDILMLNDFDRFHLVMDVIDRVPQLGSRNAALRQGMADERLRHRAYTREVATTRPTAATGRGVTACLSWRAGPP